MYRKLLFLLVSFQLVGSLLYQQVGAQSNLNELQDDSLKVVVVYSNDSSQLTRSVMTLDMLLHHFTKHVTIKSDNEVSAEEFKDATHVFYYGEDKRQIKTETVSLLNAFTGTLVSIGENREQISSLDHFEDRGEIKINGINKVKGNAINQLDYQVLIKQLKPTHDMTILLHGYKADHHFPLLVKQDNNYVFLTKKLDEDLTYYFADILHDIIPNEHIDERLAYIRLEDIHPMSDPGNLLAVGEYLNERQIPYLIAVIPVYIEPETGEKIRFSSNPEIVEVLRYLQDTGGTVIAHGYTHQYRDSEAGEGFEFWDVENDQFIYRSDPTKKIEKIKTQDEFVNLDAYQTYISKFKKQEADYINTRLVSLIHELTVHGLYPLGFESPDYAMSQQGYDITSHYFSNVFGQLQLGGKHWETIGVTPYLSSASFLQEMVLYPETIGYVDSSLKYPYEHINRSIEKALLVRDSVIGGFYHPYLGVEALPEFIAAYESIPNLRWLDFKMESNDVITEEVYIQTDGTGNIEVTNHLNTIDNFMRHNELTGLEKILWVITVFVLLFIILFFAFTIYLRSQLKMRLFKERRKL